MSLPLVGAPAPWPVGLTNQDGQGLELADFHGRFVLLFFYPKDDTPGCTIEACNFRDHAPELAGVVVLGASIDDAASHRAFKAKFNLPFDLVVDPQLALARAYGTVPENGPTGTRTSRSSFLIGPDGILRQVWPKVDPKVHWEEVRRAIAG